jgi:hypothetical protein
MSQRAEVLELLQIGVESTFGTAVAASKKILSLKADIDPTIPIEEIRGQGYKSPVGVVVGKEMSAINLSGPAAYNDLVYLLTTGFCQGVNSTPNKLGVFTVTITGSPTGGNFTLTFDGQTTGNIAYNAAASAVQSALVALSSVGTGNVSVAGSGGGPYTVTFQGDLANTELSLTGSGAGLTGGTTPGVTIAAVAAASAEAWTFQPDAADADTFDSLTFEKGSSLGASQVAGCRLDEIDLTFTPEKTVELKAKMVGKSTTDGITMTGAPTEIAFKPISPRDVDVYFADTLAGILSGQIVPLETKFSLKNRFTPVYGLDSAESSFGDFVERALECTAQITVEMDTDAEGYMTKLRDGSTKYLLILARGETMATGEPYRLAITLPCKFTKSARNAKSDVHCGVFDLVGVYDATAGYSVKVVVWSDLASL